MPLHQLPVDHYMQRLVTNMKDMRKDFSAIKANLHKRQLELYNIVACDIQVQDSKLVYNR